jgi:hypothetical protein
MNVESMTGFQIINVNTVQKYLSRYDTYLYMIEMFGNGRHA